jgi:hypothetical protein
MGLKKIYYCDICKEEFSPPEEAYTKLLGLRFVGNKDFNVGDIYSTDGTHVCHYCFDQISSQSR